MVFSFYLVLFFSKLLNIYLIYACLYITKNSTWFANQNSHSHVTWYCVNHLEKKYT